MKSKIIRHKVLFSLGSNTEAEANLQRLLSIMRAWWGSIETTPMLTNNAVDMPNGSPDFTNQLVKVETSMTFQEVHRLAKLAERLSGDTREKRSQSIINADVDILQYDDDIHHRKDWKRPYISVLLSKRFKRLMMVVTLFSWFTNSTAQANTSCKDGFSPTQMGTTITVTDDDLAYSQDKDTNKDLLSKAIDYFGGQKYHEALLTFNKLEKTHRLSARMLAYKGVCQFKLSQYENAIESLSAATPQLEQFSPFEQSIYYYSLGESYFQLQRFTRTKPYFIEALKLCNDEDHAEVCYRLGFADVMIGDNDEAIHWFREADMWYSRAGNDPTTRAHREQTHRMLRALLVTHGTSGVNITDKEAGQHQNEGTNHNSNHVNEQPDR